MKQYFQMYTFYLVKDRTGEGLRAGQRFVDYSDDQNVSSTLSDFTTTPQKNKEVQQVVWETLTNRAELNVWGHRG